MIKRFVTVKLQGSRAVVDSPIYLYQNDREICLAITIVGNKYQYNKDTKLSFTLIKPNGETVDSAMCSIINGKYNVLLTKDLFDSEEEVGQCLLQIKQYNGKGVVSLPPFAIHVLKGYSEPLTDDGLLTDEEYLILTENQKAISIKGTVKISELPTTQTIEGYLPISRNDETFKLDMSVVPTKAYVTNAIADAMLDGDLTLDGYATLEDLELKANADHNHDDRYSLINHTHDDIIQQTYTMGYSLQQQMTGYAQLDHSHNYEDLENLPTDLATTSYVDDAVANVSVDTSGLATKEELALKADAEHEHKQYLKESVAIDAFAFKAHEHAYAPTVHYHDEYLPKIDADTSYAPKFETENKLSNLEIEVKQEITNRESVCDGLQNQINGKASTNHIHNEYALKEHNHEEYALKGHIHEDYAYTSHQHDEYVYKSEFENHEAVFEAHGHDDRYSRLNHTHDYAPTEHKHSYNDLTNKPTLFDGDYNSLTNKPTIPSVEGLATETYVDEQVATKADKTHVHDYAPTNHTHSEYLTEHQDISHLATKNELVHNHDTQYAPLVHEHDYAPTLHEHSQYLTSHQDISMKADRTELHSHDNKTVLDSITSDKVNEWDNKSDFDGDYNSLINKPTVDVDKAYVDEQLATKSNVGHTHSGYSKTDHNHDGVYATSSHTHDTYVTKTELSSKYVTSTKHDNDLSNVYNTFRSECATKNHTHSDYASSTHTHDGYATTNHTHTGMLTSNSITRIEVVSSLPSTQETGVLYIVKG